MSAVVNELTQLPSSGTAWESSACWELACFCLLNLCAELVRYREKRLLGRGLEGLAGAGLVTSFSGTASYNTNLPSVAALLWLLPPPTFFLHTQVRNDGVTRWYG